MARATGTCPAVPALFVPAFAGHRRSWMGQRWPCHAVAKRRRVLAVRCAHEAEAQVVVLVAGRVVVAIRNAAVVGVVVPVAATFHPVRARRRASPVSPSSRTTAMCGTFPWTKKCSLVWGITGPGLWTYCARGTSPWGDKKEMIGHGLVFKHKDKDDIVHSRRYEFYREGIDDYRYLMKLRTLAGEKGSRALAKANALIDRAYKDIISNRQDTERCDKWRKKIANEILTLGVL